MTGDKVITRKQARDLSLIKWRKIREIHTELSILIESHCGFCELGKHLEKDSGRCAVCGVHIRCQEIQKEAREIDSLLMKLIGGTLSFLRDMDVRKDDD